MSITADMIRGNTDAIILARLVDGDSYGYRINAAIKKATDNRYELKEATLYTAFRRLEEAGYITSYWGDEESGARRRYYKITDRGIEAYRRMVLDLQSAYELIFKLVDDKSAVTEGI